MSALVVRGDARRLPLPDASVDLIVTSPPYFALRSYTDGGEHYAGQLGSEATPAAYIAALVECTREWMRVLKPSGSIFVNLGDSYATRYSSLRGAGRAGLNGDDDNRGRSGQNRTGTPEKSLRLLPERYRIACVDELGLIARAVLVWSKPNGLPESVTDRVRRSHEDWVHLVKQPRYFAAVDEIREPHLATGKATRPREGSDWKMARGETDRAFRQNGWTPEAAHPLGKLPGSVWEVATEPLRKVPGIDVDHFAAFPSEWPRRLILGWSPVGICTACGEGRRPVADITPMQWRGSPTLAGRSAPGTSRTTMSGTMLAPASRTIIGYVCACTPYTDHPETQQPSPLAPNDPDSAITVGPWREYHFDRWTPPPTRPAVCVDPFGGTGTTAHVAAALGRIGITVDLSADYCRLAASPELADVRLRKVLGLDKAPVQSEGQELLWG